MFRPLSKARPPHLRFIRTSLRLVSKNSTLHHTWQNILLLFITFQRTKLELHFRLIAQILRNFVYVISEGHFMFPNIGIRLKFTIHWTWTLIDEIALVASCIFVYISDYFSAGFIICHRVSCLFDDLSCFWLIYWILNAFFWNWTLCTYTALSRSMTGFFDARSVELHENSIYFFKLETITLNTLFP